MTKSATQIIREKLQQITESSILQKEHIKSAIKHGEYTKAHELIEIQKRNEYTKWVLNGILDEYEAELTKERTGA